jgi:hypothetical protein
VIDPVFTVCLAQIILIVVLFLKVRSLKANVAAARREVERLAAQARFLEANASHSDATLKAYKESNKLTVGLFTEENDEVNFLSRRKKVRYKSQIYLNGLPIGAPSTLKEDIYSVVDSEKVNRILEEYAFPLVNAGIEVANLYIKGPAGAALSQGAKIASSKMKK